MSDALLDAPPVEAQDDSDEWLLAWAIVLLMLNANAAMPLTMTQRARARRLLRIAFEDGALRWAQRVTAGQIDAPAWQAGVAGMIADYARQMAVAGAGTMPSAEVQEFVAQQIDEQMPFLERFGGLVAAGALSVAAMAARTRLYGGVGWGAHWAAQEDSLTQQYGVIVHYRARDDRGTCSPCHQAQARGPYIVGTNHPVPGSVCRGGGLCRCTLEFEYNPTEYARLTGRRA